jgi:hypothetical protein
MFGGLIIGLPLFSLVLFPIELSAIDAAAASIRAFVLRDEEEDTGWRLGFDSRLRRCAETPSFFARERA